MKSIKMMLSNEGAYEKNLNVIYPTGQIEGSY